MHDSAKTYSGAILRLYDFFVLFFSNTFAWGCPTDSKLLPFFREHAGQDVHMDIGVGTGYYPSQSVDKLLKAKRLILVDLNPNTLRSALGRLHAAGFTGDIETIEHDIFQPLPQALHGAVDAISLFYLLHCLPGTFPAKAEQIAAHLVPILASQGIVYGCTILGKGIEHNYIGKALMRIYNNKGIFCNDGDSAEGLQEGLSTHFEEVDVEVVGRVAIFVARKPVSETACDEAFSDLSLA